MRLLEGIPPKTRDVKNLRFFLTALEEQLIIEAELEMEDLRDIFTRAFLDTPVRVELILVSGKTNYKPALFFNVTTQSQARVLYKRARVLYRSLGQF